MGLKYYITKGSGPFVATAIHHGHLIRPGLEDYLNLTEAERLREEDPYTGYLTEIVPSRVLVLTSRFEVDLNRPPEASIYMKPEDAWGLDVWSERLSEKELKTSLENYEGFYREIHGFFQEIIDRYGYLVVFDIHSYNHRRAGFDKIPEPDSENPEINLGTGSVNKAVWSALSSAFIQTLHEYDFRGRQLDVRENVKFTGGHFSKWVHRNFPDKSCVLAIEFKKTFMNEWTGALNQDHLLDLKKAMDFTVEKLYKTAGDIYERKLK